MRYHLPLTVASIGAVAALGLLAVACGGRASPGVASVASSTPRATSSSRPPTGAEILQDALRFASCMRSRGVPNFPDPATDPRGFKIALNPSGSSPSAFQSALAACHHLLPAGRSQSPTHSQAQVAAMLAFAHCIRSRGFANFPDPTSSGDLTHEMLAAAGINLHAPGLVQAADSCSSVTHGYITKADVANFVAGH